MSASRAAAAAPAALAALAALAAAGCGSGAPERETPPAVLLIVGDTVRADHVGCYGYERETTPALDALAGEGERFDRAFAQSSWTLPSIASILTGQPPHVHGAGRAEGGVLPLRTEVATLAERLQAAGFATAAWINVLWLAPQSGAQRGFDVYDYRKTDATNRTMRDAKATTDAALAWMRRQRDAPFFMTVHYFDPHLTYDPPAPYDEMFRPQEAPRLPRGFGSADQVFEIRSGSRQLDTAEKEALVARYDGELRYMDDQIGRLLDGLRDLGRWDDALVIFVSDHGEEFWDHGGFEHGHTHYREMIRVPLIVKRPGGAPGVRTDRARHVDLAPTVLEYAGLPADPALPGRSLIGGEPAADSVAEGSLWSGDLVSVRADEGTLILSRDTGQAAWFQPADRDERRPLAVEPGTPGERLLDLLRALPPPPGARRDTWEPTEEQLERLRSLGYVR